MLNLHTRARCDECGDAPAVVQIDETFFLCASCEAIILSNFADCCVLSGEIAAASPDAPTSVVAVANISELRKGSQAVASSSIPAREGEATAANSDPDAFSSQLASETSSPHEPVTLLSPVDLDIDAAVAALETEWARAGVSLQNSNSLRIRVEKEIASSSVA